MNSCLYQGVLRHRRLQPKAHHFVYRLFMAWLDLDELDKLPEAGIRRNRLAAAAWYDADYPLGAPLKALVLNRLESLTGCRPAGRVMLLTQLRYFGFHFNPVNFYYCYDEADTLRWVLAEVRNTPWNERHYYAVDGQQARPLEKAFHVSPFNPMDMVYHWRFNAPGKTLHMHIENHQASKVFDATFGPEPRAVDPRQPARAAAASADDDPENRARHLLAGAAAVAEARAAVQPSCQQE